MAIDLKKLEKLCYLNIPAEGAEKIQSDLENIVKFIDQLQEVDTTGVEPMTSTVASNSTPERPDRVTAGNKRDALLSNAPAQEHGFFVVPKVIE